jgi:hypothetical protein
MNNQGQQPPIDYLTTINKEVRAMIFRKLKENDLECLKKTAKSLGNNIQHAKTKLENKTKFMKSLLEYFSNIINKNYSKNTIKNNNNTTKNNNNNNSKTYKELLDIKTLKVVFRSKPLNNAIKLTVIYDADDWSNSNNSTNNAEEGILSLKKLSSMIFQQGFHAAQFMTIEEDEEYAIMTKNIVLDNFADMYANYLNDIDSVEIEYITLSKTNNASKLIASDVKKEIETYLNEFISSLPKDGGKKLRKPRKL